MKMLSQTGEESGAANAGLDLNKAAAAWVGEHGDCLYRYALARVRKPEVAEDLVQETFLAAVRGYAKFGGRSSVRSWLCGILKHKIIDHYRKAGRETSFTDLEFLADDARLPFKVAAKNRGCFFHARDGRRLEQRNLRASLDLRKQSLGDAPSCANGVARVS